MKIKQDKQCWFMVQGCIHACGRP